MKDPDEEPILIDLINHYLTHQSKKKTLMYLHAKHHISMGQTTISNLLSNSMLYGAYRGNPNYCEAYIDKETFDRLQDIASRNIKENTAENRAYLFSGLIKCPVVQYKKYRCAKHYTNGSCPFPKAVNENVIEKKMLANIEKFLEDAKIRSAKVTDSDAVKIPQHNIDEIHEQIDRLNYSWQTGKIRKVEQYEKDYAELMEKLEKAEAERGEVVIKDFSAIEAVLQKGWRDIYDRLDDEHKRAFWRSFVQSIEIHWTTEKKEIVRVNFF